MMSTRPSSTCALGATKTAEQPGVPDGNWRVYLDPAGHPFLPLLGLAPWRVVSADAEMQVGPVALPSTSSTSRRSNLAEPRTVVGA